MVPLLNELAKANITAVKNEATAHPVWHWQEQNAIALLCLHLTPLLYLYL